MTIKRHFFGKDCVIDRQLLNRDDVHHKMKERGFVFSELLFLNQVHSTDVVVLDDVGKLYDYKNLAKADALVTNLKNIAIAVFTADCAPVIFFDEDRDIIAVAHAGWKGAKFGVLQNTIAAMRKLGAKNIHAQIGPMIQQDSYEISQEFYDTFLEEMVDNKRFFKNGDKSGHYFFDLPAYVVSKLEKEGLATIDNLAIDTYSNEEHYFSYRRTCHKKEEDCGRNISVIVFGDRFW